MRAPAWDSLPLTLSERLVMLRAAQLVAQTFDRITPVLLAVPGPAERRARSRTNGPACGAPSLVPASTSGA